VASVVSMIEPDQARRLLRKLRWRKRRQAIQIAAVRACRSAALAIAWLLLRVSGGCLWVTERLARWAKERAC
jgi:hypothetical protein